MAQRRSPDRKIVGNKNKELYIYGNTVREFQVERNPSIERREDRQREYNQRRRKDREYVTAMNRGYVMFLVFAALAVFCVMGYFLMLSAKVSNNRDHITQLKTKLIESKAENDDYERRIERSVNIDEVRRIAIEELGMVYPSNDQIVNYKYEESDFVRQYSDVPQE